MIRNPFLCIALAFVFSSYPKDVLSGDTSKFIIRKDGEKQGIWETNYFLSKKRKSTCEYQNGKKSGTCQTYYKSGFLKMYTHYTNNRKDGLECFYINRVRHESIKRCVRYENGKKKETIKDFWPDL